MCFAFGCKPVIRHLNCYQHVRSFLHPRVNSRNTTYVPDPELVRMFFGLNWPRLLLEGVARNLKLFAGRRSARCFLMVD